MFCPLVSRTWPAAGFHMSTGEAIRATLARLRTSLIVEASGRTQPARKPCENKTDSSINGRATRIGHLPIAFPDQMWEASGDLVSYNMDPGSYMYHNHSLTCTCAVQQIKARFNLPFPSLYRPGVQSCLIPSQQTVPGSQSKHVSGQN